MDPVDGGELQIYLWDPQGNPAKHTLSINDLYSDGTDSIDGESFVNLALGDGTNQDANALRYVADQLDRLADGLESGLAIDNARTLYKRANDTIANIMGLGVASTATDYAAWESSANPLPNPFDDTSTADVAEGLSIEGMRDAVQDAIDSLSSAGQFASATSPSSPRLFRASAVAEYGATAAARDEAARDAYRALRTQVSARYTFTDFTRFGIWKSVERDDATDSEPSIVVSAFAYSPLGTIPWTAVDNLPRGGAWYVGRTLAVRGRIDSQGYLADSAVLDGDGDVVGAAAGTFYEGDITLRVDWGVGPREESIAINTEITRLRDRSGNRLNNGVGRINRILLRVPATNPDLTGGRLGFSASLSAASVDVDYAPRAETGVAPPDTDATHTAKINGMFLGFDDGPGPRAVVGNWEVSATSGLGTGSSLSIRGVYGADRRAIEPRNP